MKILQISDTHNKHQQLTNLPAADVIVHSVTLPTMVQRRRFLTFSTGSLNCPTLTRYSLLATMTYVFGMLKE